jgi:hypothetical protein
MIAPEEMRRISDASTWWHKKAYPLILFGFVGLFALFWIPGIIQQAVPPVVLLVPLAAALLSYVVMRWLIFSLTEDVFLDGDDVVLRDNGKEDRFPFNNVIDVEAPICSRPERITLTVREPCLFGRKIIFLPPRRWWWSRLTPHPIAEELRDRMRRQAQSSR